MNTEVNPLTVLEYARNLIASPQNWTRGEYARDVDGSGVCAADPNAICFCSVGAVQRATSDVVGDLSHEDALRLETSSIDILSEATSRDPGGHQFYGSIADFNDSRTTTHEDVLRAFDHAIKLAREEV